uniref:Phosphoserine phosphatase n=1 Tax=Crassostrea virginica TaxID=6565 RepID=A0A8B8B0T3_CRAVI|nr:phosphoserine phosphatase-like [Crassostrea virginica]XP_022296624.1 phosphoserine phosphatase-like [Crassostrea virginica]XP_022296626.1 phosphoserine phosphatase-like [Crassostrea virginica]XP_022296627.1 phosphoserine phosphatase-like [Crassostrea virginica]XP_022296628.1 phosphoserine phosphatase-like [Crassostrea virginica]
MRVLSSVFARTSQHSNFLFISLCRQVSGMGSTAGEIRRVWAAADAVCFDVDSTLLIDEALDELAKFCGVGKEVQEWTTRAMGGGVSFREALEARLQIVKPSRQQLAEFIQQHPPHFSPNVQELISELHKRDKQVYLVSGGFQSIILPAAKILNIPAENVFANRLKFYFNGDYAGFDETQPTSSSGGKAVVAGVIKKERGHRTLVVVGDGATDMEAVPPADAFVGYGGNVVRESVKEKAAWFVTDFSELIEALDS